MAIKELRLCDYGTEEHAAELTTRLMWGEADKATDLCSKHHQEISNFINPLIESGREWKAGKDVDTLSQEARKWAIAEGMMETSTRGRVSQEIIDKYNIYKLQEGHKEATAQ